MYNMHLYANNPGILKKLSYKSLSFIDRAESRDYLEPESNKFFL